MASIFIPIYVLVQWTTYRSERGCYNRVELLWWFMWRCTMLCYNYGIHFQTLHITLSFLVYCSAAASSSFRDFVAAVLQAAHSRHQNPLTAAPHRHPSSCRCFPSHDEALRTLTPLFLLFPRSRDAAEAPRRREQPRLGWNSRQWQLCKYVWTVWKIAVICNIYRKFNKNHKNVKLILLASVWWYTP